MANTERPAPSAQRVADAARDLGLEVEVREFPEGTRTAEDAARAIGVSVGQIVKSLVFLAGDQPIVCLVSGSNRLDPTRLTPFVGEKVRRADADAVRAATGFAVGGVPPFGYPRALPVYCDRDLLDFEVVWAAAGTPHSVFAVHPDALVAASNATVLELKEQA